MNNFGIDWNSLQRQALMGSIGGYSYPSLGTTPNHDYRLQMQAIQYNAQPIIISAPEAPPKRKGGNSEWLDRRVDEIRVKL